jgi:hypothetical protein
MNNVEKLEKFIKDNNLEFNSGSGGDSNILALCGYACYIEATSDDCLTAVASNDIDVDNEIVRVFDYANSHYYGRWWSTPDAKKQWKF